MEKDQKRIRKQQLYYDEVIMVDFSPHGSLKDLYTIALYF